MGLEYSLHDSQGPFRIIGHLKETIGIADKSLPIPHPSRLTQSLQMRYKTQRNYSTEVKVREYNSVSLEGISRVLE